MVLFVCFYMQRANAIIVFMWKNQRAKIEKIDKSKFLEFLWLISQLYLFFHLFNSCTQFRCSLGDGTMSLFLFVFFSVFRYIFQYFFLSLSLFVFICRIRKSNFSLVVWSFFDKTTATSTIYITNKRHSKRIVFKLNLH